MDVSLRQMTYFVAVADAGSLAAAAATFPISHSAITLAINELERSLSVQLFHRQRARGVTLTDAGRQLLPQARATIAAATDFQRAAHTLGGEVAGELVVGSYAPLTASLLGRAISRFRTAYPLADVSFYEGSADFLHESLTSGGCEVALMYDVGIDSRFTKTTLFSSRPQVILSREHSLSRSSSIHLRQLAAEPLILNHHRPSQELYANVLKSAGLDIAIAHQTGNLDAIRSLVANGIGWSILLQQSRNNLSVDGLEFVTIPIADPMPDISIVLVAAAGRPTMRATAFTKTCTDMFPAGISDFEAWTGIHSD